MEYDVIKEETCIMKFIYRKKYMDELIRLTHVPDIKIITGIRRSGKSKLMDCFDSYLHSDDKNNIVHIKLYLKTNSYLKNSDELCNFINSRYVEDKNNYLLIDEIQMCPNFLNIQNE